MASHEIGALLSAAVAAQRGGRADEAGRLFEAVIAREPGHAESLNALGMLALGRRSVDDAARWFERATAADPGAPPLWLNLASAHRQRGDDGGERRALEKALAIDGRDLNALIRKAELHQRRGELPLAMLSWGGALAVAPPPAQRSPALGEVLDRAQAFVAEHTAAFGMEMDAALGALRAARDAKALRRFDAAIDTVLGRRRIYTNSCAGLHFPFLPADEFFDRDLFPWLPALEAHTAAIRSELRDLLANGDEGFQPYVELDPGTPENLWSDLDRSMRWNAYYHWKYGEQIARAASRCPATAAALAEVPRADIPGRAPTAFFSLLQPRTRIPPHTGVTNTRAIIHLPLIVPAGCGFRVGGETRQWVEGEAFAFDDTIEHEAWNDSDELRAVLILDVWNPHLTEAERELLCAYFAAADASRYNPEPRA